MNQKQQRRLAREQKIADIRAKVAYGFKLTRIEELENLRDAAADAGRDAFAAFIDSAEGKELPALYRETGRQHGPTPATHPPSPMSPAAPRNSIWQEAILAALADGERLLPREIMARLGITQPSPVVRSTLSRALERLRCKGLVEAWIHDEPMQGNAALWQLKATTAGT
jgi:hypothetical protein